MTNETSIKTANEDEILQRIIEEETEVFWAPDFWALEQAATLEIYHSILSYLISNSHQMSKDDLAYFSKLSSKPWKKKRTNAKEERHFNIYLEYCINWYANDLQPPPRKEAIAGIAEQYGMTYDAARKEYDLVMKFHGQLPSVKDRKLST